jgi:hypothetical protein
MSIIVSGVISKHLGVKEGKSVRGPWANASFIVKETSVEHPQEFLFSMFKTGDYVKIAKGFETKSPVGSAVTVEYNSRVKEWTSPNGEVKYFGENTVWKVDKVDDLPF